MCLGRDVYDDPIWGYIYTYICISMCLGRDVLSYICVPLRDVYDNPIWGYIYLCIYMCLGRDVLSYICVFVNLYLV